MSDAACPGDDALLAILDGATSDAELRLHLDRCPYCGSRLRRLGSELARLRSLRRAAPTRGPSQQTAVTLAVAEPPESHERADAPPDAPRVLRRLGRFQIVGTLGQGAFGTVYLAHDPHLERKVALEVPRAGVLVDRRDVDRFLREARAAAQLRHPNIIPVYEFGQVEETSFIAYEFVEGPTLARLLHSQGKLAPRRAGELISKLASALHYAHTRGIVHRDMKPDNVIVDEHGEPHIADFGLARRGEGDSTRTREGTLFGTPAYMSPEQASGRAHVADARADVWSLGVMLEELLTGRLPFTGSFLEVLDAVRQAEPIPLRQLDRSLPKDLQTICQKCLAKDPQRRYPTAGELADELDRWRRDEPIRARPIGPVARAWRWSRRNPAVALLATAVWVVLLAGFAVSSYFAYDAHRQQRFRALEQARALRTAVAESVPLLLENLRPFRAEVLPQLRAMQPIPGCRTASGCGPASGSWPWGSPRNRNGCPSTCSRIWCVPSRPNCWSCDATSNRMRRGWCPACGNWRAADKPSGTCVFGRRAPWPPMIRKARRGPARPGTCRPGCCRRTPCGYPVGSRPCNRSAVTCGRTWNRHFSSVRRRKNACWPPACWAICSGTMRGCWSRWCNRPRRPSCAPCWPGCDLPAPMRCFWQPSSSHLPNRGRRRGARCSPARPTWPWPCYISAWTPPCGRCWPARPTPRSAQILHRAGPAGVDPQGLLVALRNTTDAGTRQALLLALGEYGSDTLFLSQRTMLRDELLALFRRDADPGVHSAVEWLLRKWGQDVLLDRLAANLAARDPLDERAWYVNRQGQTLAVFSGPVVFQMGMPASETGWTGVEQRHARRIPRSFALGTREITVQEFLRFDPQHAYNRERSPEPACPINDVSWFDAVRYCRWLSEQEGIPESQMCFPPVEQMGPDLPWPPPRLDRTGYRLPTAGEWEYACRAGSQGRYHFGNIDSLLGDYGWYDADAQQRSWPVGLLKPNDFGLFDMHGNALEWCQDLYFDDYATDEQGIVTDGADDREGYEFELRGGTYRTPASFTRCGWRDHQVPAFRSYEFGFRIARTLPRGDGRPVD